MCETRVHLQLTYYLASGKKEKQRGEGIKEGWGGEERKRKRNEREGDSDRERYLWAWWDGVAWAPAFFGGLGWNLSPWWILSLLDRMVWRAGSPRGVLPSELSSDLRLVCPCFLMKSGDSKWTDWGSEGPF